MFERYTESARRALFFARYETSALGGAVIESEHLLLGVMRVAEGAAKEVFAGAGIDTHAVCREVQMRRPGGERLPTSVEIPFSKEARSILQSAVEEADRLGDTDIRPEHLLLGILSESNALGAQMLVEKGVVLETVRQLIARAK